MKKTSLNRGLYTAWAALFLLCAGLGLFRQFLPTLTGFLTFVSLLFFIPPAALLYRAKKTGDSHTRQLLRNLAAFSLGLTLVLLVVNFLSVLGSEALGDLVYYMLAVVSTPMICSGYWALSIFLWACLLVASLKK